MGKRISICPECDGLMGKFCEMQEKVMAPYGVEKSYIEKVSTCAECEYEISDDADGARYRALYEKSVSESIPAILDSLNQFGYSMVATERILELPFRTLSRWKTNGKPSAGGTALLRLLATFPWLLEVADNNYEETFAKDLLMVEGAKVFNEKLTQNDIGMTSSNPDSATVVVNFQKNQQAASLLPENFLFEAFGDVTPTTVLTTGA